MHSDPPKSGKNAVSSGGARGLFAKPPMNRRRKILLLFNPVNGAAVLRILAALLLASRRLRRNSLPDLLRSLDRPGRKGATLLDGDRERGELYRDVLNFVLTGCLKVKRPCLFRSLALFSYYRRKGVPVRIAYGVRNSGGTFEGHSWLVLDRAPFLETSDPDGAYSTLYVYP